MARPPPAARRPPPARRLCVIATQGHCVIATQSPRVCWLGPEPQGTPNHNFLSPNGSPWHHHLGPGDRARGQNFAANLARGVPPPQSQLFFSHHFGAKKCPKVNFCEISETGLPQPGRIWAHARHGSRAPQVTHATAHARPRGPRGPKGAQGGPMGPHGAPWGPSGPQGASCWGSP